MPRNVAHKSCLEIVYTNRAQKCCTQMVPRNVAHKSHLEMWRTSRVQNYCNQFNYYHHTMKTTVTMHSALSYRKKQHTIIHVYSMIDCHTIKLVTSQRYKSGSRGFSALKWQISCLKIPEFASKVQNFLKLNFQLIKQAFDSRNGCVKGRNASFGSSRHQSVVKSKVILTFI